MRNWKRQTKRMKRIFAMLVATMLCLSPLQQHVLAAEIPEEAVTPEDTIQPEKTTEPEVTTVPEETTSLEETAAPAEGETIPDAPETPEAPESPATSSNAEELQGAEENQEPVVKQELVQSVTEAAAFKAAVQEAVANEDPTITGVIYVNADFVPEDTTGSEEEALSEEVPFDDNKEVKEITETPSDTVSSKDTDISEEPTATKGAASIEESLDSDVNENLGDGFETLEIPVVAENAASDIDESSLVRGDTVTVTKDSAVRVSDVPEGQKPKGSKGNPCTSWKEMVDLLNGKDGESGINLETIKIILESDLEATCCYRFFGKNVTIIGGGHKIVRGDEFDTQSDSRSWYNPAIIEVNGSLYLENITLDDGDKKKGDLFVQASSSSADENGNLNVVQDAIIASYDGKGHITLGEGTKLQNFGGMSAVRLTGDGGTFTMKNGSEITGGGKYAVAENGKSGSGAVGAVWLQNGKFTMEEGSKISGVSGRAIYADMGSVDLKGEISEIVKQKGFQNWKQGVAVHLRGGANGTIGGKITKITATEANVVHVIGNGRENPVIISSSISDVTGSYVVNVEDTQASATISGSIGQVTGGGINVTKGAKVSLAGSISDISGTVANLRDGSGEPGVGDEVHTEFIMGSDAKITNINTSSSIFNAEVNRGSKTAPGNSGISEPNGDRVSFTIDGEITGINNSGKDIVWINSDIHAGTTAGHVLGGYVTCIIGPNARIHDNTLAHVINGQGGNHIIYGKIDNNNVADVFRKAFNCGPALITMKEGAEVCENTIRGERNSWDGGSVAMLGFTRMIMEKGSGIHNNMSATGKAVSVYVASGGELIMDGGIIADDNMIPVAYVSGHTWGSDSWTDFGSAKAAISNPGGFIIADGGAMPFVNPSLEKDHENHERCFTVPSTDIATKGNSVYFEHDKKTLQVDAGTKLGNAAIDKKLSLSVTQLTEAAGSYGCEEPFATFWAQNTKGTPVMVKMDQADSFDADKSVYVLSQNTNEKGEPVGGVSIITTQVTQNGTITFNLSATAPTGVALALVQPSEANGILSLNSTVTRLVQGRETYEIPYTANFVLSNTKFTEDAYAKAEKSVKFVSSLGESILEQQNGKTFGWIEKLDESGFKKGESISTYAILTIKIENETYTFLSNSVDIPMLGTYTVTFNSNGGSPVAAQTVVDGDSASRPANPTRAGYTFNGWTMGGTAYNFTTPVTSDITLTAQWTANETPAPTPTPTTPTTTTTTTPPAPAPLAMAPTVIPAAVPAAPTPAAPVEIAEPETPLAEPEAPAAEPEEEPQQIEEPEVPLASGVQGSWALLNLLLMLFTAVSGLVLTVSAARKEEENEKRKRALRISSLIPAVVSVVVFLLTENLRAPMRFVNARTMWMVLFAVAQIALIVLSRKSEEKAQVEE